MIKHLIILMYCCGTGMLNAQIGHHFFGGVGHDYIQQLLPFDDSTFLALGTKTEVRGKVWLMKINADCEIIWEKQFGDPSFVNQVSLFRVGHLRSRHLH